MTKVPDTRAEGCAVGWGGSSAAHTPGATKLSLFAEIL